MASLIRQVLNALALPYFFVMIFMAVIAVFSFGYQIFFFIQNGVWVGVSLSSVIFDMTSYRVAFPVAGLDVVFQWIMHMNLALFSAIIYVIMLKFLPLFRKSSYDSEGPYEDGFTRPRQF